MAENTRKVVNKRSIRPYEGGDQYKLNVCIDYTGCPMSTLLERAFANDWISYQSVLRNAGEEVIKKYAQRGTVTVHWGEVGKKIQTDADRIKGIMAATGADEMTAAIILEAIKKDPVKAAAILQGK